MRDLFEEALRRDIPLAEAYRALMQLIAAPAIAVMLMTPAEDEAGRTLLREWDRRWVAYGLHPP